LLNEKVFFGYISAKKLKRRHAKQIGVEGEDIRRGGYVGRIGCHIM
jgi:hypothetical protein